MVQYKVVYQKSNGRFTEERFSDRYKAFDFAQGLKQCDDIIRVNLLEIHNYKFK